MPLPVEYTHHDTAALVRVGEGGAAEPPMAASTAANAISPASNARASGPGLETAARRIHSVILKRNVVS